MNPFLNPITGLPVLKNYFLNPKRIKRYNHKQIKTYRDKLFRKIVKYAYTIPVYNKKYKQAKIDIGDIKTIEDIVKLPIISKKDLIDAYPNGIIPKNFKKDKTSIASTGGSSGKPVSLYFDFETLSNTILFIFRQGHIYNFNPMKTKFAFIANYSIGKIDEVFEKIISENTGFFRSNNKTINLNAFEPMDNIVKKLNVFNPDIIMSYPVTLQQLAYFKKKGYCKNINPKLFFSGGYILDRYTKKYVENAFDCRIFNIYQSVESAGDIAFECTEGTWHINHDFYHLEVINENMELVEYGKKGHIILTRLFGKGTPIIRYSGMDDWISLLPNFECSCGLCTPVIKNGVEGRVSSQIFLPDGRSYPPSSFESVSNILHKLNTYKITQFQTVQNKIDDIEILIVIDNELRDIGPPVSLILNKIKEAYKKKCGPDVKITVREVKDIKHSKGKPLPLVLSKVKLKEGYRITEEKIDKKNI